MKSLRTFFTAWSIVPLSFLTSLMGAGPNKAYGQCEAGCPLVMSGPMCCEALTFAEICQPRQCLPQPSDPPTPVVKIKVRVPAISPPGEPVEYHIRVDNVSPADAHHVVVKNALPANARFVRASPEPHVKEPELEWRLGTMKAGTCHDITLVLQPTNQEDLRNCARVAFEHGQCVTTRLAKSGELVPGRPPEILEIPKIPTGKEPPVKEGVDEAHQLTLSIEGPKDQYLNVSTGYSIIVANKGKLAANNLLVEFTLADKAVFERASHDGVHSKGTVAWLLGTLEPGTKKTVALFLKSPVIGELCHKATALADKRAKAQAEFCTKFAGVSALLLELSENENPIPVGGTTSYPIRVTNTGTAPVTNLRLLAVIPDSVTLTRAKASVNHKLGEPQPGKNVLVFDSLATLEPGAKTEYLIFVQGARPADVRFRIEMRADQLENGPVIQEESTRVYDEERGPLAAPPAGGPPTGQPLPPIVDTSLTRPYQP